MFRIILTVLTIFIGVFVFGQDPPNISFTRYGIENGLPNMTMNVLGQDSVGYIWLANPLTRFDGKNFKTFREEPDVASSSLITAVSIFDDGVGNLFFGSTEGVYYYDPVQEYVDKVPSIPYNHKQRSILKSDARTFWDYSYNNLYKIELPGFDTTHINFDVMTGSDHLSAKSGDSNIWMINKQKGVLRLDLKTLEIQGYNIKGLEDLSNAYFVRHKDMALWLVSNLGIWKFNQLTNDFSNTIDFAQIPAFNTLNIEYCSFQLGNKCWWTLDRLHNMVYRYDLNTNNINSIKIDENIRYYYNSNPPNNVIETPDGSLLLGTTEMGLFVINPINGLIKQFLPEKNNSNSLFNKSATPAFSINNNSFIISGLGQGIIKADFQNPIFESFIPSNTNLDNTYAKNIRSLLDWKDNIIVGSISAINLFNRKEKTFAPLPMPGNLPSPHPEKGALAITSDKSQNLLITYWVPKEEAEIFYLDYSNKRILNLTDTFPETSFYASNTLFTDSENNFWIAMQSGVIRIAADDLAHNNLKNIREKATLYSFNKLRPSENDLHKIFVIREDNNGQIWVGTSAGLFKINPENNEIDVFKTSLEDNTSLSSNDIRSIVMTEHGNLWIGTSNGGLNKYNESNNTFERYSTKDGLPDNTIYTIAEDNEKHLWMGTNKGLCWFDPETLQSHQYVPSDGIQSYEFNTNAVCKTHDDWLAFGGINGFNLFSPTSISNYSESKNLVFTSIKVNDKEYSISNKNMKLNHKENYVSFEFSLLDYYKNDKIQYAYKLDGLEKDWNYIRNAQKVSYPGLNSGKYNFMVKAASHNGLWSEKMLSLPLTITPPWWKTWWFILLSLGSIIGILYSFYKNKQDQKEKIDHLRNQISRDLHDEIGSTLSSISLFGTVAQKTLHKDKDETINILNMINNSTTQVMESMNDIVWAINSENDTVNNLLKRMRAFVSELSDASHIKVDLQLEDSLKNVSLNMVQRRNVYLIFKEGLNNAFKYSKASCIEINLSQCNKSFQLSIIDDGVGFDLERIQADNLMGGNGLKNMNLRAKELNGTLDFITSKDKGTEIRFVWDPKN